MALNKFMHPRNRYKSAKPSFLHLALKYPDFRAHTTQDDSGKVFLDFKNADALRALTTCLLKEDFNITVHLPSDRLVPTLPLRLNYIHWLEDIVGIESNKWGIDIGTGASCVYPLLGAKMNQWHFLATESDPENAYHAKKNVQANSLEGLIQVEAVTSEDVLLGPVEKFLSKSDPSLTIAQFDFCMCNPPFFADHMEAQAISTSRSMDRPESLSVSTASPQECIALGGEVGFVRKMIEDSVLLGTKIKVYSSMVGKKASLGKLKEELRQHNVSKFSITEFCQGKTMRWGIAWTYDPSIVFPKSAFDQRKEKPPLQLIVPRGAGGVEYTVHNIAAYLKHVMDDLKIHCYQGKTAKSYSSITLTAPSNTWCHQRRQRRQKQRQLEQGATAEGESSSTSPTKNAAQELFTGDSSVPAATHVSNSGDTATTKRHLEGRENDDSVTKRARLTEDEFEKSANDSVEGKAPTAGCANNSATKTTSSTSKDTGPEVKAEGTNGIKDASLNSSSENLAHDEELTSKEVSGSVDFSTAQTDTSPKEFILKCVMRLKRADEQVHLELEWLDGQSRELMHQLYTFLKNKLTRAPE